jgi:Protein kinase domain
MLYLPRRYIDRYIPSGDVRDEVLKILNFVDDPRDSENYRLKLMHPDSIISVWWGDIYSDFKSESNQDEELDEDSPVKCLPVADSYRQNAFIQAHENLGLEISPHKEYLFRGAHAGVISALKKRNFKFQYSYPLVKAPIYVKYFFDMSGQKFADQLSKENLPKYTALLELITHRDVREADRVLVSDNTIFQREELRRQERQHSQALQKAEQLEEIYRINGGPIIHPREYESVATEFITNTYIGNGAYGCAYAPAIPCKGYKGPREGYISKVLTERAAMDELKAHELVSRVDPENRYLITNPEMCVPTKFQEKILQYSCEVPVTPDARIIYFENGGKSLLSIMQSVEKLERSLYEEHKRQILLGLRNVLLGIKLLNAHNIFHCDIKPDNIVGKIVRGRYVFKIIDFGLTKVVTPSHIPRLTLFKNPYVYWPPECIYLAIMDAGMEISGEPSTYRKFTDSYKKEWDKYIRHRFVPGLRRYNDQTVGDIMKTVDPYAFGASLFDINNIFTDDKIESIAYTLTSSRFDIDDAIRAYDLFLQDFLKSD